MASAPPGGSATPAGRLPVGDTDQAPASTLGPVEAGAPPAGAGGGAAADGAVAGGAGAPATGPGGRRGAGPPRGPQPASPGPARRDARRPGARTARPDGGAAAACSRGGARGGRSCRPGPWRPVEQVPGTGAVAPLRLTRRGRRVVAGVSVAIGLSVAAATAVVVTAAGQPFDLAGSSTVVVQPGDTLWVIARQVAPQDDPRAVVDEIEDLNGLHGGELMAGQVLRLP